MQYNCDIFDNVIILVSWLCTDCNAMSTSPTSHAALFRPFIVGNTVALNTGQKVVAIVAT